MPKLRRIADLLSVEFILRIILSVFCIIASNSLMAQQFNHSDVRISLLTAAPGEPIYAVFGHSAIRVKIVSIDYDAVYNYGTFSYNEPNFTYNFARGKMNYYLSKTSYERFINEYMSENREIREQVFELDSLQTMFMLQFLEKNYNKYPYYHYNFFLDNCATRIRDLMLFVFDNENHDYLYDNDFFLNNYSILNKTIKQKFKIMSFAESQDSPTYRNLIHSYLKKHPWGKFGIDIGLGLPTDQKTGIFEQMFLPDYIFDAYSNLKYNDRPIVKETTKIFIPARPAQQQPGFISPAIVCCFILALAILFTFVRKGAFAFDFTLFFVAGLTGLLVVFLWFFTEHVFTANNLNIIWALPTHVVMAFFLFSKKRSESVRKYFLATAIISMLLIVAWLMLPQPLNPALIPVVLAIALRSFRAYRIKY